MPRIVVSYGLETKLPSYLAALAACGVAADEVVAVSPASVNGGRPADLLRGADGLLLTGGCDVDPAFYGETADPRVELDAPWAERDRLEIALLAAARERRAPVLAICRGLQVMNVALGGSLWQDLPRLAGVEGHDFAVTRGFAADRPAHTVEAADDEHPAAHWIAAHAGMTVNSRHHQAVRRPGEELVTVGRAPDGVVEAMAARDKRWWAWGVQWHPENLVSAAPQRELFERFLAACEGAR